MLKMGVGSISWGGGRTEKIQIYNKTMGYRTDFSFKGQVGGVGGGGSVWVG